MSELVGWLVSYRVPSAFEDESATEKLRRHKLLGIRANYSKTVSRKTHNIIFQDP